MALAINIVLGANTVNFSRNIQKATKKAEQELKGFAGFAQKALDKINAGTLIGAGTLTTIAAAADKMQSLASKVKLATDGANEFTAVQNQLRAVANEQRSSFEGVVDLYSSSQRALSQLGKSQQDVIGFTRNMTMAMNLGGGSAQAQAAALTQLGQALGSGALRGDEFNSVAEQAPILMELIAKKMGVATAALRDLAKDGKITADVVYDAVAGSTAALEAMASKTAFTMASGFQVIKDNFGYLVHDIINETTGIAGAISDVLAFVGQNLKTIATIAGVAAAVMGAKMLLGSAQVKEFAASVLTKTNAMRSATVATVQSAYSMQNYAIVAGRVGLALDYAKMSVSAFGVAVFGGGVMAIEKASLAMTHLTATLTAYRTQLQATWATTQAYIAQNFILANAKAVVTASFATATTAVTGYITAKRTAIANTIAYIQSQSLLTHGKNLLTGSVRLATGGITDFIGAVRAGTVALAGYTRAIVTSTIAKRAFVGTATLASTAVGKLGTAFAAVGRIIMAHPIMIIGGIIAAIVVRTMGLQKAMQSLSDAFAIAADMLGQLVDWGVDGFKSLWNGASGFLDGFGIGSKDTCGAATSYFASFFETNHTGFVGVLHVAAKVFDGLIAVVVGTIKTIWQNFKALFNGIRNGFVRAVNAVTGAIAGIANAVAGVVNSAIDNINGLIDGAADLAAKAGIHIGGRIGRVQANYQGTQIAVTQDDTNLTLAENIKNSHYGIAVGAFEKGVAALNKNKKAQDAANNSMNKGAAAADKAAKAAGGKGKADKAAANTAKQNKEAQDKLTEALQSQYQEWAKLRYEMAHPMNLEIDKVNWEIQNGKFSGLSDALKEQLRNEARQMDVVKADFELVKVEKDAMRQMHLSNADGSKYLEMAYDLQDTANALHLASEEQKKQILSVLATLEAVTKARELQKQISDSKNELTLLGVQEGMARELFAIEQQRTETLRQYNHLLKDGHTEQYQVIEMAANALEQEQKKILVTKEYHGLVQSLKTDEEKRLDTLKSQLNVLTMHSQVMGANLDIERAKQLISQNVGLATPTNHYDELNAKTQGQYTSLDAGLQALLDNERLTEEERIKIKEWGVSERAKIEKAHSTAMNALILSDSENMFGSLASIAKDGLGEQSRVYRAMFAMQQGFAIAQASIAMSQAMSKGLEKGFPLGLSDMALAVSHGAKIVSAIKSVVMPVGQAHDGIMSVPKSGTWNLEKGERVLPKHTAQNLDNTLNRLQGNGGGQIINVNVTVNSDGGDVQSSHDMGKSLGNAIKLAVQSELQKERRQGGMLYGR